MRGRLATGWLSAPASTTCGGDTIKRHICVAVLILLAGLPLAAGASYPGANGLIAFETERDGNNEIYVMNPDGTGQVNITSTAEWEYDPAFSPDGTRIAFVRETPQSDVWVMNADGSGAVNLSGPDTVVGTNGVHPTWSPDGSLLAYADNADIWVMSALDGSGKTNITNTTGTVAAEAQPAWSATGQIAYIRNGDLWVMEADGSNPHAVSATAGNESNPDWSPDGTKLVFQIGGEIWVANADGSNAIAVVSGAGEAGREPVWAPDGTKIVFSSNAYDAPNGYDLFVMDADGSNVTLLPMPVPTGDYDPSWQAVEPIEGTDGPDVIEGTSGNDQIFAGGGDDTVTSGDGDDTVLGEDGNDEIDTGIGNDVADGGAGNDRVFARAGDDLAKGGAGNDLLKMAGGLDRVFGGGGRDVLDGGPGFDTIDGGKGFDTCYFSSLKEKRKMKGCERKRAHKRAH